jgi:hypothetical protein
VACGPPLATNRQPLLCYFHFLKKIIFKFI